MSRKIFWSIWSVSLFIIFLCLTIVMGSLYNHFTEEHLEQLRNETQLVRQGLTLSGMEYFDNLHTKDFRITWITRDGQILYDSEADSMQMSSHLEREEIREALENGYGESRRYSATLSAQQLYTAQLLEDGTVLRLSVTQTSITELFQNFLIPILALLAAAFFLSLLLAMRLASRIVEPINALDPDRPFAGHQLDAYPEIRPLLQKLEDQHEQIQKDHDELERSSLIRQEFTANASHELKTPLHVISGYAELIESGLARSEDIPQFAAKIRTEAQRMSRIVEDTIDLSALDGGGADMKREASDLYRIAQNALESLSTEAADAGISLDLAGQAAVINGVPSVLYSIVYNLCDNAIKYSPAGSRVRVDVQDHSDHVLLSVADEGIGIDPNDLDRIFERFYRVDKSHSKEVGGTGLGLSIVKHAAKMHNAEIHVDSTPGSGSVFTLTFPKA